MSKGSQPRPFTIPRDQFRSQWDQIFGKQPRPEKPTHEQPRNNTSPVPNQPK
jgi:hypothetical protein